MIGKKEEQVKISTLIGEGSELSGNFSVKGSARVDGHIEGDVSADGMLIVGATGSISGDVSAETVLIGGEVQGNVKAPGKAELTASARVIGDIATAVIAIDEHAVFQGRVDMNQGASDKKARAAQKTAVRADRKSAQAAMEEALREVPEITPATAAPQAEGVSED